MAALFVWFRRLIPLARRSDSEDGLLAAGFIAAVSGYLVQAFFNISVVTVAPFYWILLGLSLGWARRTTTQKAA